LSKRYYVDTVEEDLVVRELREDEADEDPVVSDKYKTKFLLCSARCVKKCHFGSFDGRTFKCNFFDLEDTHPLNILAVALSEV